MAELLKLNESGQLSELINQNMDLAKKLREASERVDMLSKDGNETKDEYAAALNDLVVAKTAINNFKREKQSQDKRIEELESRLRNEDKSLADNPAADPAETEVLRNIIQKLRRQQERRRESSEVLLQAIGEKSKKDPSIASAVELMNAAELPLSPEELKIADIAEDHRIAANIDAAGARPREAVFEETRQLNKSTAPYKQAAQRAFLSERLESARELLQMVTEANPGDIQAICSLGVINLRRKDDPAAAMAAVENFRRAVELDSQNPYAQRMLGKSLMQAGPGGEAEAEASLKRAVELAPTNATNHVVLGLLFYETGREKEAEDEFKAAIACDDTMSESYFNLAVLYGHQGKKKKGMECYQDSLLRNGKPDNDLQKRLEEKAQ
jgi:TPR repeat protein